MSTEGLASALEVSTETIRRDLLVLEKDGAIERVHGGATVRGQPVVVSEPSFDIRSEEGLQRKQRIAAVAAELVPPGSLVMIDVGTTAMLAARALPQSLSATVVTTSLRVAVELSDRPGIDVIVAGGRMRGGDLALSGMATETLLAGVHFDVALLGSGGLHAEAGLTDFYLEEAQSRRTVIDNTAAPYVLCDATKFEKVARYRVAALNELAGVVVDKKPGAELTAALRAAGTELITAG
jgi:DeoR family fructose operon transcriptional repressor